MKLIDYRELGARAAATGGRCAVLVRHGERPPIDPADPTFGENLPITESGREMALACGRALAASGLPPDEWGFLCSRLLRTRLTAAAIAEGMGAAGGGVRVSPEASIPGLWIEDVAETHRHYYAEGSVPFTERLLRDGRAEGYRPIAESTRLALDWLSGDPAGKRLTVVCTHDVFAACVLRGFGDESVSCENWVGFLQGVALFETPGGGWECERLVPDKADWRRAFFQ